MPAAGFLKSAYLRYFTKPVSDRTIFRTIRRRKIGRIVEIGIGNGLRASRMIAMALRCCGGEVHYTGIDLFEARDSALPGLTLKQAYQKLRPLGAKVQLAPGDPLAGVARLANTHSGTELLIISADQDRQSLAQAWYYVPRMLGEDAITFVEEAEGAHEAPKVRTLTTSQVKQFANPMPQRRRAA